MKSLVIGFALLIGLVLLFVWTLPMNLVGWGWALVTTVDHPLQEVAPDGVNVRLARRWYARLLLRRRIGGHVLGATVTFVDQEPGEQLWRHELRHVEQYVVLGPFFQLVNLTSSVWCVVRGRDPYRFNVLEVDARRAAGQDDRRAP